jgi:putative tryptophan/tyrosine transport system substrate-binding protein
MGRRAVRRRAFITLLGAVAWPLLAARAQQPAMPVIGFVESSDILKQATAAFLKSLNETGYVDHHNVVIEYRRAEGHNDRLPALISDLLRRKATVIVTNGPAALAAKAATTDIPIIFFVGSDPIKLGLVASLSRPGANLTGVTTLNTDVGPKRLEVLHELVPTAAKIGVLVNPTGPSAKALLAELEPAARSLGVQIHVLEASTQQDLAPAFATLVQLRAGALLIGNDAFFTSEIELLAALSIQYAIPSIYQYPDFAAAGGVVSYGASITDAYRLIGIYTGRVLKGEKPADLPVQQSTKVELFINLKTARALGLSVPLSLLGRADELIE